MALHPATSLQPQHSFSMLDRNLHISLSYLFSLSLSVSLSLPPVFRFFALHGFTFTHVYVRPNINMSAQTINARHKNTDNTRPFIQEILRGYILGVNQPKREADYSPPPSIRLLTTVASAPSR